MFLAAYATDNNSPFDLKHVHRISGCESRWIDYLTVSGMPRDVLNEFELDALRSRVQQQLAFSAHPHQVFKTHNARIKPSGDKLIHSEFTKGAIYVVRNPLDIVDSLADHSNITHERAINLMNHPCYRLKSTEKMILQYIGTWSHHVKSWTEHREFPVFILRYEDLKSAPLKTFENLLRFLGWRIDPVRLRRAVFKTSFSSLQRKEHQQGFAETSKASPSGRFFRRGEWGAWSAILSKGQAEHIVNHHAEVMQRLRYVLPDLDTIYS